MRWWLASLAFVLSGCPNSEPAAPSPTEDHWSFVPISRTPPPAVDSDWPRTSVDRFVLARRASTGESTCGDVDPYRLMRRLHLDLTGLPPTAAVVDAFVADPSDDAYDAVVDRLIATSQYAEHFARDWLDIARYADSHGYSFDQARDAWAWRDWVIHAIDTKMPFDRFTVEQIAGDLGVHDEADTGPTLATAFLRNHAITREGGVIDEEYRAEYVADRVKTIGVAWLGLTLECARCHDHKYDAIPQRDFYRLAACLNRVGESGNGAETDYVPRLEVRSPLATSPHHLDDRIAQPSRALVMADDRAPSETHVHIGGRYDRPGEVVECGAPSAIKPQPSVPWSDRRDLARWLVAADNPLTPRVVANRAWQHFFGEGLVATPEDFGTRGTPPSDPALLDHLAATLIDSGWDRTSLHRLIVRSSTYRQCRAQTPPRRLDAEVIRDQALAASGLLVDTVGGPPVFPYQPAGLWLEQNDRPSLAMAYPQDVGTRLFRRSIYTFWKRTLPPPAMTIFDAPSREVAVAKRGQTTTPLQALLLLNAEQTVEASRRLGEVMTRVSTVEAGIVLGFRRVLVRPPTAIETGVLNGLYDTQHAIFTDAPDAADRLLSIGDTVFDDTLDPIAVASMTQVARAILNLSETMTRE